MPKHHAPDQSRQIRHRKVVVCFLVLLAPWVTSAETPGIGLIYTADQAERLDAKNRDALDEYRRAIEENGGRVIVIAPTQSLDVVVEALAQCDGLLVPGGIDVDPMFYGEPRYEYLEKTDAELDALEFRALRYAADHGLPVLGICRGHQLLNVFGGGSLIQDIPTQHTADENVGHRGGTKRHPISIVEDSILHAIFRVTRIVVNTYHHQAVKQLAPGFIVSARTDDGIVEGIERPGQRFVVGVQFHPEKMRDDAPGFNAIYARFVAEAARAKLRKVPTSRTGNQE